MNAKRPRMKEIIPHKSHLSFIYRSKNTLKMIQAFHRAAAGARPPWQQHERSRREDRIRSDHNWGSSFCFQVQLEQMVQIRVQCEKQNMQCCQHLRLLAWKTLLIPEVIFTGHFTSGGKISTAGCARSAGISPSNIYLQSFAASL